ncbi:MAG: hypothetical protein WCA77_07315, partial [Thermoplasmata archaeon]
MTGRPSPHAPPDDGLTTPPRTLAQAPDGPGASHLGARLQRLRWLGLAFRWGTFAAALLLVGLLAAIVI